MLIIIFSFLFGACSILQNGYTNQYGHYVPKNPKFKLKDKRGVFPIGLDTVNVYKLTEMYLNGKKEDLNPNKVNEVFLKFYSNGRYIRFTVPIKDSLGNPNSIKNSDLNPKMAEKGYYYSPDGSNIQIEDFVYGDGNGHYVITNYILDEDKLITQHKYFKEIYERVIIPDSWEKFNADW